MSKETEELLREYKINTYDNIHIPDDIDVFIEKGIQRKKAYKKVQLRKRITMIAACLVMVVFLTTIRISPAFASYIGDIPGLHYIVKLVNYDKGLKIAIENEFIQPIGVSDTHEDITLTVDNIIVDESRMVMFYTVENIGDHSYLQFSDLELKDENGEVLSVSLTFGHFVGINFNEERKNSGQIDISFQPEDELPNTITLEVNFSEAKQSYETYHMEQVNKGNSDIDERDRFRKLESTWKIDIPIDKEKFKNLKEVYPINKTISVSNQNINIQQFVIHPTRMELDVNFDEDNQLKIFSIENLRITDEKGEWQTITNGITASHLDENKRRYYFQSGYFTYPKELYVEGDGFYALENDHLDVVVDLRNGKLLKSPNERLKLETVVSNGDHYLLRFNVPKYSEGKSYDIFEWNFKDAKGQAFESNQTGFSMNGEHVEYNNVYYSVPKNEDMDNIITIKIAHYPNLINAPFKVRVK